MFKKILIGLAVLIVILVIVVAMQPGEFIMSRSVTINAAPDKIYNVLNTMKRWNDWSPWAKMDPSQVVTFDGPAMGVGASQSWKGSKTGEGKMTLVESQPGKLVTFQIDFYKPMTATNMVDFTFEERDKATLVTWTMGGKNNFIAKAFSLVMNMEKMMGPVFETGLQNLKALVESGK